MKHIRKFENYTILRKREEIIKEAVMEVDGDYTVRIGAKIPQSLINAYVKKVKDTTGKDLRKIFGDVDIAEEIVKWVNSNLVTVDNIPSGALTGESQPEAEVEVTEGPAETEMAPEVPVTEEPIAEEPIAEEPIAEEPIEELPEEQPEGEFEEVPQEPDENIIPEEEEEEEETGEEGGELPL